MKKKNLKLLWQLLYIVGTIVIIYLLGFSNTNFQEIADAIKKFDLNWLYIAFGCAVLYWVIQGFVLQYCAFFMKEKISYFKSLKITVVGEYYSAITPFSSGGQPMQMGYYKRYGINFAKSSCMLAIRLIGYLVSVCVIYIVTMITNGANFYSAQPTVFWLTLVGFLINAGSTLFIFLILFNRKLVEKLGLWSINVITRFKLFKKRKQSLLEKFSKGLDDFSAAGQYLRHRFHVCINMVLLSIASIVFLYSISYCVYRAMGLEGHSYLELFSTQIFLYLAVAFVPTPGAIGASEGGFFLFFAPYFPQNLMYLAMMFWRLFTYYSNLIVGAIVIVWDEVYYIIKRRKNKSKISPKDYE